MNFRLMLSVAAALSLSAFGADAGVVSAGLATGSYSQSSSFGGDTAQSAFNGATWNGGGFGTRWIQVDLGSVMDLGNVTFVINQSPDGPSSHSVYVSDNYIGASFGSLSSVASRSGNSMAGQNVSFDFSKSGRYVEIVANGGPSWTALNNVTVSTVSPTAAVPEPSSYLLAVMGLAAAAAAMRRRPLKP